MDTHPFRPPTCGDYQVRLSARHDGEGDWNDAELDSRHLATCMDCRGFERDLSRLNQAFRSLDLAREPLGLLRSLRLLPGGRR